jgi:pectate lyase
VTVINGAHHVWIDHCDISDGTDGNLDVTLSSDFVTISWTKFHYTSRTDPVGNDSTGAYGHRFSNLVGGADNLPADVGTLNVTWHHDWWADHAVERMPRVRYGKNHIFNNLYSSSGNNYCARAGMQAALLLENNVFTGVASPHEFNSPADQGTAFITATNDTYTNTTGTRATGGGGTAFTTPPYAYTLDAASSVQAAVQSGAGPQ